MCVCVRGGGGDQLVITFWSAPNMKIRELLRKRHFDYCGIAHLHFNLLLDAGQDEELKAWRNTILSELEKYVVGTKRFITRKSY